MSHERLTTERSTRPQAVDGDVGAADRVARDDAYHLLQNQRRRRVLRFLSERDWMVNVGVIAEHVAAIENDVPVDELDAQQRKRVYISLYQSHLPKLDEHDVVDYDQSRGTVEPRRLLWALEPYLVEEDIVAPDPTDRLIDGVSDLASAVGGVLSR
jgi:hypothetical protein